MKFIILLSILCWCVQVQAQHPAFVECQVKDRVMDEVQLFKVVDGQPVSLAKATCTGNGYVGFQFIPDYEGFYVVGDNLKNQYPVYLKPGDRVSLVIGTSEAVLAEKKNSRENRLLYAWLHLSQYVRSRSVQFYNYLSCPYSEYFPEFEKFLPMAEEFKKRLHSGNAHFDALMKRSIDFAKDYYALAFIQSFRRPEFRNAEKPVYYSSIYSPTKLQDTVVMQMPYGARFLERYAMNAPKPADKNIPFVHLMADSIPNNRLKGELVLKEAARLYSYSDYMKIVDDYKEILTPAQNARLKLIGAKLYPVEQGGKAENFTYPDINGRMVSLTDFKGKVVVVDVWATWCAPCRAQLPHLIKLEEEMKDKEVVFIGVSVDSQRDYEKWKKMVNEMKLGGVQLFADQGKQIREAYKISGIPRFMVFDRTGNIVSQEAPRPSTPELKQMIERELKK